MQAGPWIEPGRPSEGPRAPAARTRTGEVRRFILRAVRAGDSRVSTRVADVFGMTLSSANAHLRALVDQGALVARGNTRGRQYRIAVLDTHRVVLDTDAAQHAPARVWETDFAERLSGISPIARSVAEHGCVQALANALDHAGSPEVAVAMVRTALDVQIEVLDHGVGIFRKIASELDLASEREALLALAQGKLTTEPTRHRGEGIFFSSRMFDEYVIDSKPIAFSHDPEIDLDAVRARGQLRPAEPRGTGTWVVMSIALDAERHVKDVFDAYSAEFDGTGRTTTRIPLRLLLQGGGRLVSRSQAARLLGRVDGSQEIVLDFRGVER